MYKNLPAVGKKMDRYSPKFDSVGPKPQFNVVFFNKRLHLQTNEKFCQELIRFINADDEFADRWGFFSDDLQEVLAGQKDVNYVDGEPDIVKAHETILLTLTLEEASRMSECVLNFATPVSQKLPDFPVNTFVAFGRRLRGAVEGEHLVKNSPRQTVIVERRILR